MNVAKQLGKSTQRKKLVFQSNTMELMSGGKPKAATTVRTFAPGSRPANASSPTATTDEAVQMLKMLQVLINSWPIEYSDLWRVQARVLRADGSSTQKLWTKPELMEVAKELRENRYKPTIKGGKAK